MVKIHIQEDCGNAPKMQYIKDFCIASARGEIETVMNMVTDDITLEIPCYTTAKGKEAVQEQLLADMKRSKVTELKIDNILSHGNRGAANGSLTFTDSVIVAFCTMYTFNNHSKNAKLKLIQTYSIVLK